MNANKLFNQIKDKKFKSNFDMFLEYTPIGVKEHCFGLGESRRVIILYVTCKVTGYNSKVVAIPESFYDRYEEVN